VEAAKGARSGIDDDARILQRNDTENRLRPFRTEDHLGDGLRADEADAGKTVLHFDWPAIGKFINRFAFAFDARRRQFAGRRHAIYGPRIDQEIGLVCFAATSQAANSSGNVSDAHKNTSQHSYIRFGRQRD